MAKTNITANAETETGPTCFQLHRPVEFRGTRHTEFTCREPKIRDVRTFLKAAEADTILAVEEVLANLANVDSPVMGELSPKDFGVMKRWLETHLADLAGNDA